MEIKRKIPWPWGEGNSLTGLGYLYEEQGQYPKAAEYYEKALEAYEKARHEKSIEQALGRLRVIYKKLRLHRNAIASMEKALEKAQETKNSRDELCA